MLDFFSGIGGFRLISRQYGYKCLGYSEINKTAKEYYKKNYDCVNEIDLGNINEIKSNPFNDQIDLITAGVPCQSWSIAGKNNGFNDERGKLWFSTFKILDIFKPNKFIFENVKGLHDPRNKEALELIKYNIQKRNYYYKIILLNANDYGSVQIRKRIFIIGFKKENELKKFIINIKKENQINSVSINNLLKLNLKEKERYNDKFIFTDVRGGDNVIHSWDLIKTTNIEKEICNLLLKNRRKKKYGKKDGNPISYEDFKNLNTNIKRKNLESLVYKNILG